MTKNSNPMYSANQMQVGGSHYRSDLQHWDVVSQYNVAYLEGCASKYVSRWRKKNGIQDLEKALHFSNKLWEVLHALGGRDYQSGKVPFTVIDKFVIANNLEMDERHVLTLLWSWKTKDDVQVAVNHISSMIREAKRGAQGSTGAG